MGLLIIGQDVDTDLKEAQEAFMLLTAILQCHAILVLLMTCAYIRARYAATVTAMLNLSAPCLQCLSMFLSRLPWVLLVIFVDTNLTQSPDV